MTTPLSRHEFERAFNIAAEQMRQGKIKFAASMIELIDSLRRVRDLPNGRLDLLSIDERARLHANSTVTWLEDGAFEAIRSESGISEGENVDSEIEVGPQSNPPSGRAKKAPAKKAPAKKAPAKKAPAKKAPAKKAPAKKAPAKKAPAKKAPA
ncbi:AVAST type 1 anti-phage system protein Avs1c, partial [Bremerella sp. JC817]|uniref:AVAST type 1 anti-phage system protein Avs1c n=1 Tax=Bremerella sp. JC817 TaxID=3231756 RepID=UPI0034588A57